MDTRRKDAKEKGWYRARLSDSDVLYDVIDRETFPYAIAECVARLKHSGIYVFMTEAKDAIVVYEPAFGNVPWVNTHSWSLKGARGKALKKFYMETGMWLVENTPYTTIVSIVPKGWERQGMFLSVIGAKRRCEINGDVMYTFDTSHMEEYKERLR